MARGSYGNPKNQKDPEHPEGRALTRVTERGVEGFSGTAKHAPAQVGLKSRRRSNEQAKEPSPVGGPAAQLGQSQPFVELVCRERRPKGGRCDRRQREVSSRAVSRVEPGRHEVVRGEKTRGKADRTDLPKHRGEAT